MARQPRFDLPAIPQHIEARQRRLPCFLDAEDRVPHLNSLNEALLNTDCDLHAYLLIHKDLNLVLAPPEIGAVAK